MRPESKVIAQRYARRVCIKRLCRKIRKFGKVMVEVTVVITDDFTERAVVDEIIRQERRQ